MIRPPPPPDLRQGSGVYNITTPPCPPRREKLSCLSSSTREPEVRDHSPSRSDSTLDLVQCNEDAMLALRFVMLLLRLLERMHRLLQLLGPLLIKRTKRIRRAVRALLRIPKGSPTEAKDGTPDGSRNPARTRKGWTSIFRRDSSAPRR